SARTTIAPQVAVTPRELPVDIANFCGRTTALDELDAWNRQAARPRIVAICGTAGVGKTALGVHWGLRHAEQFPDGQLYINLRGYDPGPAVEPSEAVSMLLR